jgi:hypothetical protein
MTRASLVGSGFQPTAGLCPACGTGFSLWFLVKLAALTALAASAWSQAPPCQTRALKTVNDAKRQAILGASDQARRLLEQADRECGTSPAVLAEIAQVYEQIGDKLTATIYSKNAQRLVAKTGAAPTVPSPRPAAEKSFVRAKYALIVGIGKFQSGDIRTLKFAAKDAHDFAAVLADPQVGRFYKENIRVLTDEQATTKAIRSALADIAGKAMNDGLVLLYFSTHGSSPSMDRSKIGSGYLVTYDTEVNDLYASAYGMDELANFMRQRLRAERIVTFLDTCYSGDTTRILTQTAGSKGLEVDSLSQEAIGMIAQGKGSVVITSSNNRELSWESDEKQNSFFTLFLIDSLRAHQGLANVRQLYTDIQRQIPTAVREYTRTRGLGEKGKGAEQNPAIYPSEIPDIVIGAATQ